MPYICLTFVFSTLFHSSICLSLHQYHTVMQEVPASSFSLGYPALSKPNYSLFSPMTFPKSSFLCINTLSINNLFHFTPKLKLLSNISASVQILVLKLWFDFCDDMISLPLGVLIWISLTHRWSTLDSITVPRSV